MLATGRRSLPGRAELHQPNTIRTTCADGPGGAVAGPEQIDRLKVSTLDGGVFEPGKIISIEVLVQAAPTPADDSLDLYYLADIRNMAFTYITTVKPSVAGPQVLTAFYTLPAGGLLQGVRARFRYRGDPGICNLTGSVPDEDDVDDVMFRVGTRTNVAGDFDGDATSELALFRPSDGTWPNLQSTTYFGVGATYVLGLASDARVPGDYDGDGKADPAIYRPSTGLWAMLKSGVGYSSALYRTWGVSGDIPVPGDYDGDGRTDIAVYHPSTGDWSTLASSANFNASMFRTLGSSGDIPVLQRPR